jgi:predicted TIM-barrel fold metal-dependent hydrolase
MNVIDGDGHVIEGRGANFLLDYLPEPYRHARVRLVFPEIDHLHVEPVEMLPDAGVNLNVGPKEWGEFLLDVGIEASVLYPSNGLSVGLISSPGWAIAATTAYNDWLHAEYTSTNPALHGMALLPLQDPQAAVDELRRAVEDLGMKGAMLPGNGIGHPLGSKAYWPVYAEAERLGCALAVHGGSAHGLGLDNMGVRPGGHALAHPLGVLISLTNMVFNGVFDHFPGLRVGYLEGGVAWLLVAIERFDRSYSTHIPFNPRGELLQLDEGQTVADYLVGLADAGRFVIGCEGEEPDLVRAVGLLGSGAFMFSSDFPHEVSADMCKHELGEVQEHELLTEAQKRDILGETARRFYCL